MDVEARSKSLIAELESALEEAAAMGFDCSTQDARDAANELLRQLAAVVPQDRTIDIAVGEDGTIEITAASDVSLATVDVSPTGRLSQVMMRDLRTGAVTPVPPGLSNEEVAWRIGHAA